MTLSQAAQEKPTSPRTARCPKVAGRCEKDAGHNGGHYTEYKEPVWSWTVEAAAATPSLDPRRFGKAIRNTGTDWNIGDIGRVLNEYDALSASSEPSKAAATPSLPDGRYALGLVKRIHSASEEWTKYDEDTPGDAEQAIRRIGKSVRAELGLVIEALARLDEGSATPDQGKGEPR